MVLGVFASPSVVNQPDRHRIQEVQLFAAGPFRYTSPARSSTRRCFITPNRDIASVDSSSVSVCPSRPNSRSSRKRRVRIREGFEHQIVIRHGPNHM